MGEDIGLPRLRGFGVNRDLKSSALQASELLPFRIHASTPPSLLAPSRCTGPYVAGVTIARMMFAILVASVSFKS